MDQRGPNVDQYVDQPSCPSWTTWTTCIYTGGLWSTLWALVEARRPRLKLRTSRRLLKAMDGQSHSRLIQVHIDSETQIEAPRAISIPHLRRGNSR